MKEVIKIKSPNRSRTPESFRKEMNEINPNIKIIGDYTKAKDKIECECLICGHVWYPTADKIIHGSNCPKCAIKIGANNRRKSDKQYIEELKENKINIEPLGQYINANTKILHKCLTCGFEWNVAPSSILSGYGCPECAKNKNAITEKDFLKELNRTHPDIELASKFTRASHYMDFRCKICDTIFNSIGRDVLIHKQVCPNCYVNPIKMTSDDFSKKFYNKYDNIRIIENFIDALTPINVECKVCRNIWSIIPRHSLRSCRCPNCVISDKKIDFYEFLDRFNKGQYNISFLSEYNGYREDMKFKCNDCEYEWISTPQKIIQSSHGCPKCAYRMTGEAKRKTHEEFISNMHKINDDIKILGEYVKANEKLDVKCKICGYIWQAKPNGLLCGRGCPHCRISHGERIIENYFKLNNINYVAQITYPELKGIKGRLLSYDFYLPEYNLLIEFQGKQHEKSITYFGGKKEFEKQQEHDKRKHEYAKLHNINLLEIWYYDINNIEKILNKELNKLNKINNLKLESVETVISA